MDNKIKKRILWLKKYYGEDFILLLLEELIKAHQSHNFLEMFNQLYLTYKEQNK